MKRSSTPVHVPFFDFFQKQPIKSLFDSQRHLLQTGEVSFVYSGFCKLRRFFTPRCCDPNLQIILLVGLLPGARVCRGTRHCPASSISVGIDQVQLGPRCESVQPLAQYEENGPYSRCRWLPSSSAGLVHHEEYHCSCLRPAGFCRGRRNANTG